VTDLGIEVASQMEPAAQVTRGELTFLESLTKIFPNNQFVMCQCSILLETNIVLNTRVIPVAARTSFATFPAT
jgi:hypothetical protein